MNKNDPLYCRNCTNYYNRPLDANKCDKCPYIHVEVYDSKNFHKEEKKMIVTIIGSLSKKADIIACKEYWERFGHKVNCPCDPEHEKLILINTQSLWINNIAESDLVVAIPKVIKMPECGETSLVYEFGECTSYEIAIAAWLNKHVIFWY